MRKPVRRNIHFGSGQEGQERIEALDGMAEDLGLNRSEFIQMIADGELEVRMATKVGDRVRVTTVDGAIRNAEATIIGTVDDAVQGVMYEVEFDEPQKIGTKHKTSEVKPFECFPLDTAVNVVPNSSAID